MAEQSRRLDSWKEIAEYLGRDVRTVMRWAKSHGLPARRVAGGKGRSVFAFTNDIDSWLAGNAEGTLSPPALTETETPPPEDVVATATEHAPRTRVWHVATIAGAALLIAGSAMVISRTSAAPLDLYRLKVAVSEGEVLLSDGSNPPRAIHHFEPGLRAALLHRPDGQIADLDADGEPEILAAVSFFERTADRSIRSGELLNLTAVGKVRWRFGFNDTIGFRDERFTGPWALTDWLVRPSSPRYVAVSAHHFTWWASMVALLDQSGNRLGTFVNPGWIESLQWIETDRLMIGGFNNVRNEAMVAMFDSDRLDGQAPGSGGTAFACATCSTATPLFYATLPRSELNLASASRFNRAKVSLLGDRVIVTTIEIEGETTAATAIYEFDRSLRLLAATYSERYWDAHRRLELEGRLTHSREACPERSGPPAIHVWAPQGRWIRTRPAAGN